MAADSITKVSSQSWFGRIGGAVKGVLVGLLLFVVAFPLLFWNEGRSVKRYKTLKEGGGAVVSVPCDRVDAANEGKLVHVTGDAQTDGTLADPVFGVSAQALRLKRTVEMYQWKESSSSKTREKLGGGSETATTYTYKQTWSDRPIDSARFEEQKGHQNPDAMPFESTMQDAERVTLGAFTLSPSLVGMVDNFESLPVASDAALVEPLAAGAKLHGGGFYIGTNPAAPRVGDTRVSYEVARPTQVSVMARQVGQSFAPYVARTSGTLELLQTGAHSADEMIARAQEANAFLTWILRLAGFLVMLIGLNLVFRPLSVLAAVLPFLGRLVGAGTGLIALLLSAMLSLITIAVAWIVYRPVLGIALLAAAVGIMVVISRKFKAARPQTARADGASAPG